MISLSLLLMIGVESVRDGYIVDFKNCVYRCVPPCDGLCKKNGGKGGSCSFLIGSGLACWCNALPDNVPIKDPLHKCPKR
uniref:Anti-insect Ac4 n=1 Tax=Androctonus crassicauda TaxID=122909 RepID=SCX4A_ANDCR|nr:RecName: Full=Anti-insect Ac4; AltName: Full=Neurotoxin 4; Flags: Precursor [Androctonus crassicauda]ADE42765.1 neurotoxin 4 precursor [Androctonus crassicauda]